MIKAVFILLFSIQGAITPVIIQEIPDNEIQTDWITEDVG